MTMTPEVSAPGGTARRWDYPVRMTALHHRHVALGASILEHDGWLLPRSYGSPTAEVAALRTAVGLLDISESGKIDLRSNELDAVLAAAFPSIGSVDAGTLSPIGGDGWVCRPASDQALLLTAPRALQDTLDLVRGAVAAYDCAHMTDLTGALCGVRLLGPRAPAVLERLSSLDLAPDRFGNGRLAQGAVAKIAALILRRDTADVYGYDLYVERDLGAYLWDSLLEVGDPLGLRPAGRDAEEELD